MLRGRKNGVGFSRAATLSRGLFRTGCSSRLRVWRSEDAPLGKSWAPPSQERTLPGERGAVQMRGTHARRWPPPWLLVVPSSPVYWYRGCPITVFACSRAPDKEDRPRAPSVRCTASRGLLWAPPRLAQRGGTRAVEHAPFRCRWFGSCGARGSKHKKRRMILHRRGSKARKWPAGGCLFGNGLWTRGLRRK